MNPDTPLTPRQEIEVRLTALLMGELSPEEAAVLKAQVAADAELSALYARLRRATALLREASAIPDQPVPARLSDERRARLLAHFKTVAAPTAVARPQRDWSWRVPLSAAAVLVVILGGLMFPAIGVVKEKSRRGVKAPETYAEARPQWWTFQPDANPESEGKKWAAQAGAMTTWKEGTEIRKDSPPPSSLALIKSGAGTITFGTSQSESSPPLPRNTPSPSITLGGASGPLPIVRDATRSLPATTPPTARRSGGAVYVGTVASAGKADGSGIAAAGGDVSPEKKPANNDGRNLNDRSLGQQLASDAPAPVQPASSIVGRVEFFSDAAARDSTDPLPDSRAPILGDIPILGKLFPATTAARSASEVPAGFATKAQPAGGPMEDPRIGDDRGQLARTQAELAETRQMIDNLVEREKRSARGMAGERSAGLQEDKKGASTSDLNGVALDGDGSLALAGSNTFTGGTVINGGTLAIAGANGATVAGGTFAGLVSKATKSSASGRFENPAALEPAAAGFPMIANQTAAAAPQAPAEPLLRPNVTGNDRSKDKVVRRADPAIEEKKLRMEAAAELSMNTDQPVRLGVSAADFATGTGEPLVAQSNALKARLSALVRDLAAYSVKDKETKDILARHGYNAAGDSPAPAFDLASDETSKGSEIRQQAGPNLLREMATASLKNKEIKDLLARHGYVVAPPPAPAAEPVETPKVETANLASKLKKADVGDATPAKKPAAPAAIPQPEVQTSANAFSTFSLNVSEVAFKLAAASLEQGQMPDPASVRSEEFVNAFDYRDPEPAGDAPLACATERARYPFAQNRDLLRCSVKTAAAGRQPGRALNLVLLLDNSGSMERADRVRIVREALRVLSEQLQPQDKLSVVTFARTPRLWADGVPGNKAAEVTARCSEITPQGGTNIDAALDLGYATALRHYQVGSINRVVLLTDGAANLGDVNPDALQQKVETHRKQGVALDCFGIGWEGLNDDLLEQLSRHGDGRYGFINTPEEAATEFAGQLAGALRVAASDVKVQVEFNPRRVTAYRQIGYAKHQLTKEQFRDNTVDAAEIGAAESGNALYVVEVNPRGEGDLATVRVRFKVPGTDDYKEHEWAVPFIREAPPLEQASPALRLAGTSAAFAEWLVASPYATEVTPDRLLGLLNGVPAIYGADPRPKKLEWMIRQAKSVSGR